MRLLLPYFVEFSKDGLILTKFYFEDYAVARTNQKPIIRITNSKSIFSINDNRRKIWTLNRHEILQLKGKEIRIIAFDFC